MIKNIRVFTVALGTMVLGASLGWGIGVNDIQIHGFVAQQYLNVRNNTLYQMNTDTGNDAYTEAGVNFTAKVSNQLRIGMQLLAREFGAAGNNEFALDWAMGDYKISDRVGLRFGKIKRALGLHNSARDVDMARTWIMLPQGLYQENWRDLYISIHGAEVYGSVDTLEYQLQVGTTDTTKDEAIVNGIESWAQHAAYGIALTPDTGNPLIDAQLAVLRGMYGAGAVDIVSNDQEQPYHTGISVKWKTPVQGLKIGASHLFNPIELRYNANLLYSRPATPSRLINVTGKYEIRSVDSFGIEYAFDKFTVNSEYMLRHEIKNNTLDVNIYSSTFDSWQEMYYVSLVYQLMDGVEIGTYYDVFYPDRDDKDGSALVAFGYRDHQGWKKDLAFAVRWDVDMNWTLKAEYHTVDGTAEYLPSDITGDERYWDMFAVKAAFNF